MTPSLLTALSTCCLSSLSEYDLCKSKLILWADYILANREKVSEDYECFLTKLESIGDCSQLSEREFDELWLFVVAAQTEILATLDSAPAVNSVVYAATIESDLENIPSDSVFNSTLTGDLTLDPPVNPVDGQRVRYHFVASGANRTVTLDAAIKTATGVVFDGEIASGSTRILELTYISNRWALTNDLEFVA